MKWYCGIDVGAVNTKIAIINGVRDVYFHQIPSGASYRAAARQVLEEILVREKVQVHEIVRIHATGCGAGLVDSADEQASDLACSARGIHYLLPNVKTVIDVGGQASKVVRINEQGKAINFISSERCATGSGRFLQVIARVLQVDISETGSLSMKAEHPISFSTNCAVFGESEAISRVAEGTSREDILAGVHVAMATKIASLVDRVKMSEDCAMTGGGALDIGLVNRVEEEIGTHLFIPDTPQFVAVLGAALSAWEGVSGQTMATA